MKILSGEIGIAVHDLGGPPQAPTLLWSHANGLAALAYGPLLRALSRRLRVLAFDSRGHGASDAPAPPFERTLTLEVMKGDFARVVEALRPGATRLYAAGHSIGALPLLGFLAHGGRGVCGAAVFEAAVFPPPGHTLRADAEALSDDRAGRVARRRRHWETAEALAEALGKAAAFAPLSKEALREVCEATLEPDGSGGARLRCDPALEAFLFTQLGRGDAYGMLARVASPLLVVGGDRAHPGATWATRMQGEVQRAVRGAEFVEVAGSGHMLPLERPEQCAELLAGWIERCEAGGRP